MYEKLQTLIPMAERPLGVVVVDHGSQRTDSNRMLLEIAAAFRKESGIPIVEPAHMEIAEPSVETAFARCVEQGAKTVVVLPYFLLPGRHWDEDIPRLAAAAAGNHPGIRYYVAAPIGMHPLMHRVVADRIEECLAQGDSNRP